ncbi:MAG: M3 family oligoendopeptidase [Clostridiales bacterium]|nr:M3 family oligoendopeptidase [Clostridiales bacterium]
MKFRVTKRTLLAAALAALFLLAGCFGGDSVIHSSVASYDQSATYDAPNLPDSQHEDVMLSDMSYERPDIDGMRAAMDDLQRGVSDGKPAEEMIAAYEALQQQYDHADSMLSLAYLLYAFDVTDTYYRDEYAYLQSALSELDGDMQSVSAQLFESSSEAERLAKESFGEGYVDAIIRDEAYDDTTVQELLSQEEQLTLDYDNLSATFSILDNGQRWTYGDIVSDLTLGYDEYNRLYDAYCAALNEKAGDVFLQQLAIRTRIASRLGYADYSDYCYDTYGRDYSPADAGALHAAVKRYIAPLFIEASESDDTYDLDAAYFDEDAFFSELASASNAFSPLLGEPVSYLLQNRLYDFTDSAVKMDTSFTTYLSDYRAPFIFSRWTGSAEDIATSLHELGHFTSYYHNAASGYSAGDNLDLAEVDSQALVLLLFEDYEGFYGDLADEAKTTALIDAMYALLSGCMEDEFQQEVYANPAITLDEMNALYLRLAGEYGLEEVYGYQGTEWVLISHTFQTPLYYISYAVSMVPSLELFDLDQSDPAAAKTAYFNILMRDQYASLEDVLSRNGLDPVFSDATIERIAEILRQYV